MAGRGDRDRDEERNPPLDEDRDRPIDDDPERTGVAPPDRDAGDASRGRQGVAYWERGTAEVMDRSALARPGEPPVVARLVVEIRSDGRHTIARGALEDAATGRGVAIEAAGRSPLQLALSLARALVTLPVFGRAAARALLRGAGRPGGSTGEDEDPSRRRH